tara:strand:+ start:1769 stop:2632 length:864 start_codon:yes stop_codon:yes gene_type:complete
MSYHDLNPIEHGVNWSALKVLLTSSPLHFYNRFLLGVDSPASAAMIFGRLIHCAVLEDHMLTKEFAVKPEAPADKPTYFRTKDGRAEMELWKSRNKGRDIVKAEDMDRALAMVGALRRKDRSRFWLWESTGQNEQAYQWEVELPDFPKAVLCRGKMDRVAEVDGKKYIVDYKSTAKTPTLGTFGRTVGEYLYHAQMAFYMDGEKADGAVLVAQETREPYDSAVYVLSAEVLDEGRRIYAEALQRYADCVLNHKMESPDRAIAAWPGIVEQQDLSLGSLGGWADRSFR